RFEPVCGPDVSSRVAENALVTGQNDMGFPRITSIGKEVIGEVPNASLQTCIAEPSGVFISIKRVGNFATAQRRIRICAQHEDLRTRLRVACQQLGLVLEIHDKYCIRSIDHFASKRLGAMIGEGNAKFVRRDLSPRMSFAAWNS